MERRRKWQLAVAAVLCSALLLGTGGGTGQWLLSLFKQPGVLSFLVYLETGRMVTAPLTWEMPDYTPPVVSGPQIQRPVFQPEDEALVQINPLCAYAPDVRTLLCSPLSWDLTQGGPAVLILHTHATEGYTPTGLDAYEESSSYRTLDEDHNMVRVGAYLAQLLRSQGIQVLHDHTYHDHPSYNGSYNASRKTAEQYLKEYPSIRMVVDLHRDALELTGGKQLATAVTLDGKSTAQLMMVVGTDAGGLYHPGWKENMALALKLQAILEKNNPGICRPLSLRTERFNQDLSAGALLIEVGAAGDTLEQALAGAEALAEGIVALSRGTATAGSTS